uniref:Uncharacterized protein n=1 Tax=Trypanosoma vivax (strain Y486) TaxID=1055687 RepID=G0UCU8_TRYVY|nr:hypothetical protein TVY486_1111420 [Trypanosoma vivax Y486]
MVFLSFLHCRRLPSFSHVPSLCVYALSKTVTTSCPPVSSRLSCHHGRGNFSHSKHNWLRHHRCVATTPPPSFPHSAVAYKPLFIFISPSPFSCLPFDYFLLFPLLYDLCGNSILLAKCRFSVSLHWIFCFPHTFCCVSN